ncbi:MULTISPECIES: ATP-dependent Clp protease adapter ClpS [unclassified Actinotalea]|uniref:ATP-dependent Clp protease adapter ClpS n=1 Tax=unclassified Actinotalea TaxID=2638618 RepID=UPI0015F41B18
MGGTATLPLEDLRAEESVGTPDQWVTVVWNDPVNLMSYVTYVFRTYFRMPAGRAERLMRQVHEQGRATVSTGTREEMERDTQAMHGYGLWATVQAAGR